MLEEDRYILRCVVYGWRVRDRQDKEGGRRKGSAGGGAKVKSVLQEVRVGEMEVPRNLSSGRGAGGVGRRHPDCGA